MRTQSPLTIIAKLPAPKGEKPAMVGQPALYSAALSMPPTASITSACHCKVSTSLGLSIHAVRSSFMNSPSLAHAYT